uniref:Peptidase M12B domain-containing protein n=1 Tax=Anopheles atroparvus TaxID=41427 RepID=A0AAG5CXC9_ANOAO
MTTRCYTNRRKIVCFFVIVAGLFVIFALFGWVIFHLFQRHVDKPANPTGEAATPSWLMKRTTTDRPRVSFVQNAAATGQVGVGVLVESDPVPPYETPPNDTSPGGSGRQDGKGAIESTLRLSVTNESSGSSGVVSSVSDGHISTNSIISNNLGNDDVSRPRKTNNGSIEYVYITKVQVQSLHQDDLLYNSQADVSDGQRGSQIHRTGAFRSRSSKIWDPHPQYELTAFGNNLHLKLWHDDKFISKDMKVTHFWPNETLRRAEDHIESNLLQGCFYKGVVLGDDSSSVRVSLCEGMHGHIVTSNGSFLIEPVQNALSGEPSVLHRIQRLTVEKSGTDGRIPIDGLGTPVEDCAVRTDDETDARELMFEGNHEITEQHSRSKRSASHPSDNEHTIEVLVAVDNKMRRYHGDALKSYVLTLMSIVSSLYADASIGNSMKIAVSHILYIHHDLDAQQKSAERGLVGVSASDMLQDFCRFKQTTKFHHDAALMLTREKVCRNPAENNCDTLGLAELGTICGPAACAIVQDNGLSASFTIAHELGHVLGMPHDDDSRCLQHRGNSTGNDRIMTRTMDQDTHPWLWSNCSRHILTEYLEKHPDNCLRNHPTTDLIDPTEMDSKLAGEKFTNNEQCELVFGNGSKICSYMPVCNRLWCMDEEASGCKTQHMPWADGTECDEGHWCQKGHCVAIDRTALQPRNGGWGSWSSFGRCSRSCGGGVQNRTRECDSPKPRNGGKFCSGMRIDYRPCNIQPCPDSRYNFREEQCHEHDGQNFGVPNLDTNVRWIPKYGTAAEEQCKLYCRVQNLYFKLRDKVIDGTPCTFPEDSFDMCINGQCRKAGCDYVLDSDSKLDQCGVCNGDNSTCRMVRGQLPLGKSKHYKPSYDKDENLARKKEFNIPEGATNLNIVHDGYMKDAIYLSLTSGNEIIFNDPKHLTPQTSKQRLFAGVRLEYTTVGNQERITSTFGRPLREKLTVKVVYKSENYRNTNGQVNYHYLIPIHPSANAVPSGSHPSQHHHNQHHHQHYGHNSIHQQQVQYTPIERTKPSPEPFYQWKMSTWMQCDQQCSGKRRRTAVCYNTATENEVAPDNCNETAKPQDSYEPCNTECTFFWEADRERPECSNACGEGIKQYNYRCVRSYPEMQRRDTVDTELCSGLSKPVNDRESCWGQCNDAVWLYSQWTRCFCNNLTQTRAAKCLSEPNGARIDDKYCEQKERKEVVRDCTTDDCPKWEKGEYTPQMHNTQYSSSLTDLKLKQHSVDYQPNLNLNPSPNYWWHPGPWGNCSAECNGGFKKRIVRCESDTGQTLADHYCTHKGPKPAEQTNCNNVRCPYWNFGQWSQCNDECIHSRQVLCQDHRGKESDQCSPNLKPPAVESCCKFKWRYDCSGPCDASGCHTPRLICKRLFPKSADNPRPLKTSRKVDDKYCAKLKKPPLSKEKKKREHCFKRQQFRWEVSPWSKCSVGCGTGLTVRNVTCTNGCKIEPKACNAALKPKNTNNCEAYTHCRWKPAKWGKCNCKGRQNRTVKCYDEQLKVESNRCLENMRPKRFNNCEPPPNCPVSHSRNTHGRIPHGGTSHNGRHQTVYRNCRDAQRRTRIDGEYTLNVNGTGVKIYCRGMATRSPTEYLTLAAGPTENYAIYVKRRAADANKCQSMRRDWEDETISYGATHYRKVRFNLRTMQVVTNDFHYTNSSGRKQPFGSAGDCYSYTGLCPQGDFAINLVGTPFRIKPNTTWKTAGVNSVLKFLVKLEPPYKKVRARCGGYCGSCFVSPDTNLYLELEKPNREHG